jgi:hypothetical protein
LLLVRLVFGENPWQDGIAETLAEGKRLHFGDYVETWGWWAALAAVPVVAAALATFPHWLARSGVPAYEGLSPPPRPSRTFVALVIAAVLAGAFFATPRLSQSLFEDERYNVQWSIDGFYERQPDGEIHFREADWRAALWHYEWPNNHVVHTLLARVSVGVWRAFAQPGTHFVHEPALRLPAFVAGLCSIAALAALLWRLGYARAGVVAAWLLALHPWHVRYASEARGYTLAMVGSALLLIGFLRVLHHGTWRRWAFVGAVQFLVLWTYPAALWFVATTNLVGLSTLLWVYGTGPSFRTQVGRWAVVGSAGAVIWTLAMAPNLAQLVVYMGETTGNVTTRWWRDVGALFLSGMSWGSQQRDHPFWELASAAASWPLLFRASAVAAALLFVLGAGRLGWARLPRALFLAPLVLPPAITLWLAATTDALVHPHYLVAFLPGGVALVALGLDTLAARLGRRAAGALLTTTILIFGFATLGPRRQLATAPLQPLRESVELTRRNLDPLAPDAEEVITATSTTAGHGSPTAAARRSRRSSRGSTCSKRSPRFPASRRAAIVVCCATGDGRADAAFPEDEGEKREHGGPGPRSVHHVHPDWVGRLATAGV